MKDNLEEVCRRFHSHPEFEQMRILHSIHDLGWSGSSRLLRRLLPQSSDSVKTLIAHACGNIRGSESRSILLQLLDVEKDPAVRWSAINSLTFLTHLHLEDGDLFYEIARSEQESLECRETALWGLMRISEWFFKRKKFDRDLFRDRLLELREQVRPGNEDYYEGALSLFGIPPSGKYAD